jgi:hypothetical protein
MSAHTPGPWKHEGQGDITGIENDGDIQGAVDVCSVYLRTLPGRHEANARLIAAAPDLLDALQAGPSTLHWLPSGDCDCSQCQFVRLRRKAISKATGQ